MLVTLRFVLFFAAFASVVADEPPRQGGGSTGVAYTPIPEHLVGALLQDVEMDGLTMEHASVFAQQRVAALKPAKRQMVRSGKVDLPIQACDGGSVCPSATVEQRSAVAAQQQATAEVQQQALAAEMHQTSVAASPKSYVPVPDELMDALLADVDMDEVLLEDASVFGWQRSARIDRKGNDRHKADEANVASSAAQKGLDMPAVDSSISDGLADALLADIAEDELAFDDVSVLGFQTAATVTRRPKKQEAALTDEHGSVEHLSVEEVGTTPLQPAAGSIALSVESFVEWGSEWGSDDVEAEDDVEAVDDVEPEAVVDAGPMVTPVGPILQWGTEALINSSAMSNLTGVVGSHQGLRTDKFDRPDSAERAQSIVRRTDKLDRPDSAEHAQSIVRRTDKLDRPHSHDLAHGQWLQDFVARYHNTLLPLGFLAVICLTFLRVLVAQVRKLSDAMAQNEGGKK